MKLESQIAALHRIIRALQPHLDAMLEASQRIEGNIQPDFTIATGKMLRVWRQIREELCND